jgi:hypothetical protein
VPSRPYPGSASGVAPSNCLASGAVPSSNKSSQINTGDTSDIDQSELRYFRRHESSTSIQHRIGTTGIASTMKGRREVCFSSLSVVDNVQHQPQMLCNVRSLVSLYLFDYASAA